MRQGGVQTMDSSDDTAMDGRTVMYDRGQVVWHTSEDGGLPDVGISVGLGEGAMLYAGDLAGSPGWSLAVFTQEERLLVADDVEPEESRYLIERLSVLLSREPNAAGGRGT